MQVDVYFDCALSAPIAALTTAGFTASSAVKSGTFCVVEGSAPATALAGLAAVPGVTQITTPSYLVPTTPRALRPVQRGSAGNSVQREGAAPAIDQAAITIMHADQFIAQTGIRGAGVTIGVQSSGVASLATIQGRGELPGSIKVLFPAGNTNPQSGDEGTMLLEELHAVAPAANLLYCGPATFVDYLSCVTQLIAAGATIVLDDTSFAAGDLMSQNNAQSVAVSQILAQHPAVMLMSSAGNNQGTYWEGNYQPVKASTTSLPPLSCPAGSGRPDAYVASFGTANSQTLSILSNTSFPLLLTWADPPAQVSSRFDVFWFAAGSTTPAGCMSAANATGNQLAQSVALPTGTYTLVIASPDATAAGKFLKLWAGGNGMTNLSVATSGGLISPQDMSPGVLTVGAVDGADGVGDTIEPFSSTGPLTVVFPAPAQLQAPTLVAPDGVAVDAAGTHYAPELFPDGNFYGTSASVPNVAAVAALLRSAFPALSVAQISSALESGAIVLGAAAPNGVFGYGRVDALGALATLPTPTITALTDQTSTAGTPSTAQPITVSGTGSLRFTVTSSNAALVPAAVTSGGTPGVNLSPGCGTSSLTCTVSVTPVAGQSGTAIVTLSVADGANRLDSTQMMLTVAAATTSTGSASAAGSTSSTSGVGDGATGPSSQSGGGGGGGLLQGWELLCLTALLIFSRGAAGISASTTTRKS